MAGSNAGNIRAGRAFVEIGANTKELSKGLAKAGSMLREWGAALSTAGKWTMGIGSTITGALAGTAKIFSDMGSELWDMAGRTGLSVEALSELKYAAEQSGASLSDVEAGTKKMGNFLTAAARGGKQAQETLGLLGLKFADLANLSPEDRMKAFATALDSITDPSLKAALAQEIFGKAGTKLLPMMEGGAKGMEAMQEKARKLGLTMSKEDAAAADEFGDVLGDLWAVVKRGTAAIGSALVPALQEAAQWTVNTIVSVNDWIKSNKELIAMALKVAVGVTAAGAAMLTLGTIVSGVGGAFAVMSAVVAGVGAVFTAVGAAIGAILTPVGLVISAVVAGAGAFLYFSGTGAEALSWLGKKFQEFKDFVGEVFQGISDALAAGDIGAAAKILWLTLKLAWEKGTGWLLGIWESFRGNFIKVSQGAFYGVQAAWEESTDALARAWIESSAWMGETWDGFVMLFYEGWESMKAIAKKAWNWIKSLFDDDSALEAANAKIDAEKQAALDKKRQEMGDKGAKRQQELELQRKLAKQQHEAEMRRIGEGANAAFDDVDKDRASREQQTQDDIGNARRELQDALAAAREKRAQVDAARLEDEQARAAEEASRGGRPKPKIGANALDLAGVNAAMEEAAKIGVKGTFNAAEIAGLAAGDASDRLTKASESTAANTKRIAEQLREMNGSEFE